METKYLSSRRFICSFSDCDASYNKEWKLNAHMCKHTGQKPYTCDNDGCGKSFCTTYHLARHQLTHSGEKPFKCVVKGCAGAFTTNTNLQRHINRTHERDKKQYVCEINNCGLVFKKNKQLKSHQCDQHAWRPSYQCSFEGCQMEFTVPSKLKRHEKVHRGYPCKEDGCAFMGKTWTEYTKHRKDTHKVLVQCDQCKKVFRDSWFLHQHQRVHADERKVLKCPRDGCDRSFTTSFNLQSHVSSFHEELRPYVCPREGCGKAFAMKQSLQRHRAAVHDTDRKKTAKQRPKRSLASRLSGYNPTKRTVCKKPSSPSYATPGPKQEMSGPAGPVELVSLLHDTTILCNPALTLSQPVILPV